MFKPLKNRRLDHTGLSRIDPREFLDGLPPAAFLTTSVVDCILSVSVWERQAAKLV